MVPRRLAVPPISSSLLAGWPRTKRWRQSWRLRATSTISSSASALTTDTPTPCSPPAVW